MCIAHMDEFFAPQRHTTADGLVTHYRIGNEASASGVRDAAAVHDHLVQTINALLEPTES